MSKDLLALGRVAAECFPTSTQLDLDFLTHPANSERWNRVFGMEHVGLVVGRGMNSNTDPSLQNKRQTVIFLDRFGGAFKGYSGDSFALWMDFNLTKPVALLPKYQLAEIIVDYSTWRYLEVTRTKDAWVSLLKTGGRLVFEAGIASFKICRDTSSKGVEALEDWQFECFNPCHPVFTLDQLKRYLVSSNTSRNPDELYSTLSYTLHQTSNPRYSPSSLRFNERVVIPAFTLTSSAPQVFNSQSPELPDLASTSKNRSITKQELGALLKGATSAKLVQSYRNLFPTATVSVFHGDGYPITTSKPISQWIEIRLNNHTDQR